MSNCIEKINDSGIKVTVALIFTSILPKNVVTVQHSQKKYKFTT